MPKFVISYTSDGGYNAECTPAVRCLEYESLEKLKADLEAALIKERSKDTWGDLLFADNRFDIDDLTYYEYNKKTGKIQFFVQGLSILPLEEWFEQIKEDGKSDFPF
jgi:hypothetical protein